MSGCPAPVGVADLRLGLARLPLDLRPLGLSLGPFPEDRATHEPLPLLAD